MGNNRISISTCPVCGSQDIKEALTAVDYTVSKETFPIWQCEVCTLRFTQDIPGEEFIGRYYQSADYISHSNTGKGIVNRLYLLVRNYTLKRKRNLIISATNLSTGSLLDVGAGTGAFASAMRKSGWRVVGLEPDTQARQLAQQLNQINLQPSQDLFSLPEKSFDAITLWHVLEHVHNLQGYLAQLKKLLTAGGRLFIAVPNYTSYDAELYHQFWAAYDVPRHLYHFSPRAMNHLLSMHQLKLLSIKPMWFDSYYVSLLSEKYKTGAGNLLKGAWNGFVSNNKALANKERCSSLIYVISH